MKGDKILCDGQLCEPEGLGFGMSDMLSANFVYQKIHTLSHRPLHAKAHADLLAQSYKTLYGTKSGTTPDLLEKETAILLEANRYPLASILVSIYLMPPSGNSGDPIRILSCEKQLLYKGYTLWHTPAKAIVIPLEYPFPQFKTAISLAANTYATDYARRKGADCALSENKAGHITCAGENPVFAVSANKIITTPLENGTCDSVERCLGIKAAEAAGFELCEEPLETKALGSYDELFVITPQGVSGIRSCSERTYPNSTARKIASFMESMTGFPL